MITTWVPFFALFLAGAFSEDEKIRIIDSTEEGLKFVGNRTSSDHFKLLQLDGNHLLIGARNAVYNISMRDFVAKRTVIWPSTAKDVEMCRMKGNDGELCHNYIRVLAKGKNGVVLICGTNAFKPLCRLYTVDGDGKYVYIDEFKGNAISPYDPRHNSSAVFLAEAQEIYAGTVADFAGTDALVYRKSIADTAQFGIRTERSDSKCLNDPNFVGSFEDDGFVYFWFREKAMEYANCGKAVYSRIARVCTKDKGGPRAHGDSWTSFLKTRLNCSIPGDYPFYFNEIEAISDRVVFGEGSDRTSLVYAVFNTPFSVVRGSAICAFDMREIRNIFESSSFKSQSSPDSNWKPVLESKVPKPRPGSCGEDSRRMSDEAVAFVKSNPLMEETAQNYFHRPLLIHTGLQNRFTQIVVDSSVTAVDGKRYDVLFVGTDKGEVVKVVNLATLGGEVDSVVVETTRVFSTRSPVRNLLIYRPTAGEADRRRGFEPRAHLVVVSDHEVRRLPLHHCETAPTCADCVALRDPFCAWQTYPYGRCVAPTIGSWTNGGFLQSITTGYAKCPPGVVKTTSTKIPPTFKPQKRLQFKHSRTAELITSEEIPLLQSNYKSIDEAPTTPNDCKCEEDKLKPLNDGLQSTPLQTSDSKEIFDDNKGDSRSTKVHRKAVMFYSSESLGVAVICALVFAVLVGFIFGYQCSQRNCLRDRKQLVRTPSALSHQPIKRSNSGKDARIDAYEATPKFIANLPPTDSPVSFCPNLTPPIEKNYMMMVENAFSTLPKDYKVKKIYL